MTAKQRFILLAAMLLAMTAGTVGAQQPNFSPALYGDGALWGTKGTTELPAPRANNLQSFDALFVFVNGAPGQLPLSEAAPGNPMYNGGRWFTHTAMWTAAGMAAFNPLPVVTSYDQLATYVSQGYVTVAPGSPTGGPPPYFQCPLLPVKWQ